jgi:hypothetical protein
MRRLLAAFFFLCAGILPAQTSLSLDGAVRDAADYFGERLSAGARIVVLNIQSDYPALSDYIIDGLTTHIVNDGKFRAVERRDLSQLQNELNFQLSGAVSDETALSIGKLWGAQVIIRGSFAQLGGLFQLRVQALNVETSEIQGMQTISIHADSTLSALLSADGRKKARTPWLLMQGDEGWKRKWLYPGVRLGVSPHWYQLNTSSDLEVVANIAFEAALSGEVQITKLFALQTEIIYSGDTVSAKGNDIDVTLSSTTLTIPALAKLTYRPGNFYLAAFAGPYFTIPLGTMEVTLNGTAESYSFTAPVGITGGVDVGVKLGPGLLFLDLRYGADLTYFWANDSAQYTRSMFVVSLGYNYGVINKDAGERK